jgi:H+-translocating NAD(P) transhydrogenase subunit alpha
LKIAVLKEGGAETRVAAIPETVKKFVALGASVAVEEGAGEGASIGDSEYVAAGATAASRGKVLADADVILCVTGPNPASLKGSKQGALLIGALDPAKRRDDIAAYASAGIEALAMEWMPRITRAQSMDILSSQSNLAGYKAVVTRPPLTGGPSR